MAAGAGNLGWGVTAWWSLGSTGLMEAVWNWPELVVARHGECARCHEGLTCINMFLFVSCSPF